MTPLEIRPVSGAGAEVLGVDISNLSVGDWNQIEAAFGAFGAIIFRDQILNEQDHLNFARRWGTIRPSTDGAHLQHPTVDSGGAPTAGAPIRGAWRSERSYDQTPAMGSVVVARSVPTTGVFTLLSSTSDAFDALTSSTQRELEGLTAIHSKHAVPGNAPSRDESQEAADRVHHPLVIRHPISGRKTLFVNPSYTVGIAGVDEIEGLALLNQLYEHCQREEFVGRIDWEVGTVALWDDRSMWNFSGIRDLDQCVFHRVGIEGVTLTPAAQSVTREPSLTQRAGATLAGGVITAAMMGIAEVIDPERVRPDIEIVSEAPEQEPLTPLDFGGLPPLD